MESVKTLRLFPAGTVTLPPSKSLSHRAVICAGLAALSGGGESTVDNLGSSQDIDATLACMEGLGATFEQQGSTLQAKTGMVHAVPPVLDCGESGSTLRFLLPVAALSGQEHTFTGRGRLLQRPMAPYEEVFKQSGVLFQKEGDSLHVKGPLHSGHYTLPGDVSSQFISGLLLALPLAEGDSSLTLSSELESAAYVAMTLAVMEHFGVTVHCEGDHTYRIPGGQHYTPAHYTVEGDYSQAAFFLGAAALGQPVRCGGLSRHSLQGDAAILPLLNEMGAAASWKDGLVSVQASPLKALTIDARPIPDLVPPLAALCCFCEGESRIVNAGRLRLKESDRLDALATELSRLGADICQGENHLVITGKPSLAGGRADAHGDHRIAMAAALAALRCQKPVELTGWENVQKSYPGFWADFEKEARHG